MFDVPNTPANAATAAAVNARLDADASLNRAKARTWTLAGIGGLLTLVGIGVGAVIAGYRAHVELVSGKVQLEDTALRLDNPTVRLDTSGATVRLDASSLPRAPATQPQSGAKAVVNYIIFHQVDFADGTVESGWEYRSSEDAAPQRQFCHYRTHPNATTGVEQSWTIAEDGKPVTLTPPGFDVTSALRNCVWFRLA